MQAHTTWIILIILAAAGGFAAGRSEAYGKLSREWGRIAKAWADLRDEQLLRR